MKQKKVVLVAGGTSGIGEKVVDLYLKDDCKVYAVGKTEQHCNLLKSRYANTEQLTVIQGDLTNIKVAQDIINQITTEYGYIDYLVNSIGTISGGGLKKEGFDDWNYVIQNNLNTLFNITKTSLSLLEKGIGKSIVTVSSVCSLRPCTSLSYSVSKAGTDMFVKVLAKELAENNIRINAVNPGVVRSNLQLSAGLFNNNDDYEKWIDDMKPMHPLHKVGEPIDIASTICFLNSEQAKWITGSIISVDGGRAIV